MKRWDWHSESQKYHSDSEVQREVSRFASGTQAETPLGGPKETTDTSAALTQLLLEDVGVLTWPVEEQFYSDGFGFFDSPSKKYSGGVIRTVTQRGKARTQGRLGKHLNLDTTP